MYEDQSSYRRLVYKCKRYGRDISLVSIKILF